MASLRVEIDTDKDKIFNEDLNEIAKRLGASQILQIFSSGSKVILNLRNGINRDLIDDLEGSTVSKNLRLKSVNYEGKQPKILVTVAGLDFDTKDEDVIAMLNDIIVFSKPTIYRAKYNSGILKGICNGKRQVYASEIKKPELFSSYNIINNQRIRLYYNGMKQACGWCYCPDSICPSRVKFSDCKAEFLNVKPDYNSQITKLRTLRLKSDKEAPLNNTKNNSYEVDFPTVLEV